MSTEANRLPRRIDALREQQRLERLAAEERESAQRIAAENRSHAEQQRLSRRIDSVREAKRIAQEQKRLSREASNQALRDAAARAKAEAEQKRLRILKHLCSGLIPKKVALIENMPLQSVRHAVMKLRSQSGATSREQLGVWACKQGLL